MCLIAVAYRAHPDYPLVVAANRDEFHARPALAAQWWPEMPAILGGRDQQAGGTWLAVSRQGRFAAVTNVRRMLPPRPGAPSRGQLVSQFVDGRMSDDQFMTALRPNAASYAGFNLMLYADGILQYAGNQPNFEQHTLEPGIQVISNASLNTPWPKSERLRAAVSNWLDGPHLEVEGLFTLLSDPEKAPDAELPDTGVGLEMERFLSSPFIQSESYGTRASTVLSIRADGIASFIERRFDSAGHPQGETREQFQIENQ